MKQGVLNPGFFTVVATFSSFQFLLLLFIRGMQKQPSDFKPSHTMLALVQVEGSDCGETVGPSAKVFSFLWVGGKSDRFQPES